MADKAKVRIRMYRQGLGDCFLLTFNPEEEKAERVHMLIDCGTIAQGVGVPISNVIDDIKRETDGHLHVLVVTHEHKDHVSGFNVTTAEEKRRFEEFEIDETWLAWTENRELVVEAKIPKGKIKDDSLGALKLTEQQIRAKPAPSEEEQEVLENLAAAIELLKLDAGPTGDHQVFGADKPSEFLFTVDGAMKYAASRNSRYFSPGDIIAPKAAKLPKNWNFYVLGPPKSIDQLSITEDDTVGDPELYLSAGNFAATAQFLASTLAMDDYRHSGLLGADAETRAQFDSCFPFDARFRIEKERSDNEYMALAKRYERNSWRCIDYEWLASVDDFALQMNNLTNNTSLVLAMECIDDGRVLLFPGDAQLGNWQTWDGSPEPPPEGAPKVPADGAPKRRKIEFPSQKTDSIDLLKRTVFYKVGHHSSHNATTIAGLKLMNTDEKISNEQKLVAMISVESAQAKEKYPGWNMPDAELYTALLEKTEGRVLRADMGWPFIDPDQKPEDTTQKPLLWDKKDLASKPNTIRSWPKVQGLIAGYQKSILAHAKPKEDMYIYTDPNQKYRVEYPITATTNQTKIPCAVGDYIDYFLL